MPGPAGRRRDPRGRHPAHHRRSRQYRNDARSRYRAAAYRPHPQPGAARSGQSADWRRGIAQRVTGGYRTDPAGLAGPADARGDDRRAVAGARRRTSPSVGSKLPGSDNAPLTLSLSPAGRGNGRRRSFPSRGHLPTTGATAAFFAAAILLCPVSRAAESPEKQLKSIEQRLDESREKEAQYESQAAALAAETARLREESIAAAKAAQEHEAALSSLEDQLAVLDEEEKRKLAEIKRHRAQERDLLMALQRLARNPPEGLALAP